MAADENMNFTKCWITWKRKIEELDQVRQYFMFNILLRMGNVGFGGVLEMSAICKGSNKCDLLQGQRWKADIL